MKCLIVTSASAEVLFYWSDPEFQTNLVQQHGAVSQPHADRPPAFEDSINTLFAPIIISCSTLVERLEESYTSFTTKNNHIYALHQFDDSLYIAMNGDGDESEEDLKRKIYVMKKLVEVHFGMVTLSSCLLKKHLRPSNTDQRNHLWKKFQSLLETYGQLKEQDQSFLVEAVERLIHPTLCEQCIEFLERRLIQQINNSTERGGEDVLHAFILVQSKLLAFYSSRNASSLTSSDLLALILIVQDVHPSNSDVTPDDADSNLGPEVYFTPDPSPTDGDLSSTSEDMENMSVFEFVDSDVQMAEDSLQTLKESSSDLLRPTRVFLEVTSKEGFCPMMPHSMYCLPVWPGITLVLLTKIPNSQLAVSAYIFLENFTQLEKMLNEAPDASAIPRGQHPLHELRNKLDKFIQALASTGVKTSQIHSAWAEFKNKVFSRGGMGLNQQLLPCCRAMKTQLCDVFRQCFGAESTGIVQHMTPNLQEQVQSMLREKLVDWKDFLLVKSTRNITMVSYLEDFPGLIHFIYVDRTTGQMLSPSINITEQSTSELGKGPLAHFVKKKVWDLVGRARHCLQKGYTTLTQRDGDYYMCYFLWFENETGYKLEVVKPPVLRDDSAPIGMLAQDYYRKLLRYYSKRHHVEVVKCYELFTIHLGVIPTDYILQHCCQLARKLWEPSRIPLL